MAAVLTSGSRCVIGLKASIASTVVVDVTRPPITAHTRPPWTSRVWAVIALGPPGSRSAPDAASGTDQP
ncbi:MAG TPA: hypothetical protein VE441_01700, partial [Mycobacterium sp.]|nr:hypothetical protein [Mycobacterium sp.]